MRARWRGSVVLAALAAGVWACGSSSSPGGTGGAGSDAGASVDAGVGVDAGSDAGPGGTDGGGSTDGGTGGGGGSTDGGTGGGGVAQGCEGVVPDRLGASFTIEVPTGGNNVTRNVTCDSDTSDESGNIASAAIDYQSRGLREWHLYDSNGARLGQIRATPLFPQGSGYEGLYLFSAPDADYLRAGSWTPDGKLTEGIPVDGKFSSATAFRAWPNGLFVATVNNCGDPNQQGTSLRLFDQFANEKARAGVRECGSILTAAVDANQNWLLLLPGLGNGFGADDLIARWFDPNGAPLTDWFRFATLAGKHAYLMHALIGGGAALQIDGTWTYFFPSGKSETQPAPAFLTGHPSTDFTLVRGARAYALLPRTGDTTQMELYSASGNKCGSLKFPSGGLTTGADGSVIASSGDKGCTKTVWPGLLR